MKNKVTVFLLAAVLFASCRPYFNQANTVKPDKHKKAAFNC